jgi:hypothetical protein
MTRKEKQNRFCEQLGVVFTNTNKVKMNAFHLPKTKKGKK